MPRERDRSVPSHVGRRILKRGEERRHLRLAGQRSERVHDHLPDAGVVGAKERLDSRHDGRVARRAERPDRRDTRLGVRRVQRLRQVFDCFGGQRRVKPSDREREVTPHERVVVLGAFERFHERGRQRAVGADFRIRHQARQLVGRGPAARRSARANLGEVVLRGPLVVQHRAESDIHGDRDCYNGQRNQKELNGQGGRRDEWVSSRAFALDQLVHVMGRRRSTSETSEAPKFYHLSALPSSRLGAHVAECLARRGVRLATGSAVVAIAEPGITGPAPLSSS